MARSLNAGASVDQLLELYDAQVGGLYAFIIRRCGDAELAEDLAQEAFVAAARRFRDTAELPSAAWLYQVARSRLIDHWRSEARRARKLRLLIGGSGDDASADPADSVISGHRVMAALDELPVSQRAALALRYLDGYRVSEVAEAMGRSTRATESLLARARRNLELRYEEQDHD